ncbi:unnamed protein product [Dovyalis caffra]|uniref:Uncharacterized protein n=1 Tax=Dovyalis caffra TaxID=77055 RepID=A0AAV1RKU5_9ROSI|nr:unnamed protein product [Dovyalis caffra]
MLGLMNSNTSSAVCACPSLSRVIKRHSVLNAGEITYSNGFISQLDQFTALVEPIASTVPYKIALPAFGSQESDWPDSGGECGVPEETMFDVPDEIDPKPRIIEERKEIYIENEGYSTDYGMLHFCIADGEQDRRKGSEQYAFIEKCLASVDKQKQPRLIFAAHLVPGVHGKGKFCRDFGRNTRCTFHLMDTPTTMKGHALFTWLFLLCKLDRMLCGILAYEYGEEEKTSKRTTREILSEDLEVIAKYSPFLPSH